MRLSLWIWLETRPRHRGCIQVAACHLEKSYDLAITLAGRHHKLVDLIEEAKESRFRAEEDEADYYREGASKTKLLEHSTGRQVSPESNHAAKRSLETKLGSDLNTKKHRANFWTTFCRELQKYLPVVYWLKIWLAHIVQISTSVPKDASTSFEFFKHCRQLHILMIVTRNRKSLVRVTSRAKNCRIPLQGSNWVRVRRLTVSGPQHNLLF